MLKKAGRAKANGAGEVFADVQSPNGKSGTSPPKGRGPCYRASSNNSTACKTEPTGAADNGQAQSRNGSRYGLLDERPLLVLPSLAKAVGVEEAIALQQLHFHLVATGGKEHDGLRWYRSTREQWQNEDFPFWP